MTLLRKLLSPILRHLTLWCECSLTLFDMGFFEPSVMRAPYHNFVVIAPMTMKFGTGVKLDVFNTVLTKKFVTSLLLHHYNVITCILAQISDACSSHCQIGLK